MRSIVLTLKKSRASQSHTVEESLSEDLATDKAIFIVITDVSDKRIKKANSAVAMAHVGYRRKAREQGT